MMQMLTRKLIFDTLVSQPECWKFQSSESKTVAI